MGRIDDIMGETPQGENGEAAAKPMTPKQRIREMIEKAAPTMIASMPSHIDQKRLMRLGTTAVVSNPDLLDCHPRSLLMALMEAAQLGLEPNNRALGHCWIIPFAKKGQKRKNAQLILGYRGCIVLAMRSGKVKTIAARAVYKNDVFEFEFGLEDKLKHVPCIDGDRGPMIAVYAVANLVNGGHVVEVMSKAQVDAIKLKTQFAGKKGPWADNEEEMVRKTGILRIRKYMPLSAEFDRATGIDEMGGEIDPDGVVFQTPPDEPNGDVGDSTAETPPETQEAAAEQQEAPSEDDGNWPKEVEGEWVDSAGTVHDPTVHSSPRKGQPPTVNKDGTLRARRGVSSQQEPPPADPSEPPPPEPPDDYGNGADEPHVPDDDGGPDDPPDDRPSAGEPSADVRAQQARQRQVFG